MSETNSPNWTQLPPDAWLLVIPGVAEALVAPRGGMFDAAVCDLRTQQVVWMGEKYPTVRGAKLASRVAFKRLGYWPTVALIELPAVERDVPQSIWKSTRLEAILKGKGIVVACGVNVLDDDHVEGVVKLGSYVFREEYPDEWSAKRGVLQWAQMLIDRHA
ncbi:hypothetical protein FJ546_10025 [Mesorhizobium sp. B2-4-19]|uniref:hypothetical protein n=1 Tax=Mesorhizobium sp. B2-4-19 TaxID=2589930 RepID=UPI00112E99B2|nr:hypothetical protein [Mesorhizobium sp. B2-4-19]TPK65520.1 hypothetical protein FJ546_10025 [Mesorhizobium sp. B2-4-19]